MHFYMLSMIIYLYMYVDVLHRMSRLHKELSRDPFIVSPVSRTALVLLDRTLL